MLILVINKQKGDTMKLYKTLLHCLLVTCAVGTYTAKADKRIKAVGVGDKLKALEAKTVKAVQQAAGKTEKRLSEDKTLKNSIQQAAGIGERVFSHKNPTKIIQSIKDGLELLKLGQEEKAAIQKFIKYLEANTESIQKHKKELVNIFKKIKKHAGNEDLQSQFKALNTFVKENFDQIQLPEAITSYTGEKTISGTLSWFASAASPHLDQIEFALNTAAFLQDYSIVGDILR